MNRFSAETEEAMRHYGLWGLTSREDCIKGVLHDSSDGEVYGTYLDAKELRELATACVEIADYLESVERDRASP